MLCYAPRIRAPPPQYPSLVAALKAIYDDPIAFGVAVGYRGTKDGRKQFGSLHRLIADRLRSHTRTSTLVPRNHAKSTIISEIFPAWSLVRDPSLRIMIASASQSLAEELTGRVRDILGGVLEFTISDEVVEIPLADIFPHVLPSGRRDSSGPTKHFDIRGKAGQGREHSVFAASPGTSVTGKHPTMILVDDPCDNKNTATFDQRQKVISWFLALEPILQNVDDAFHHIGTVWSPNDVSQVIADRPDFDQLRLRAWVPENPETGIADGLGPGPLPGGRWAEKYKGCYPLDANYRNAAELRQDEQLAEDINRAHFFAAQYLNEPMVAGDTIFPDTALLQASHTRVPAFADYKKILLWDPTGRITGTAGDANGLVLVQPVPVKIFRDFDPRHAPNLEDDRNVFICRLAKQVQGGIDDALQVVERMCAEDPDIRAIWIEEVAAQAAIAPWLKERGNIKSVAIRGQKVGTSAQAARLQGLATAMREGQFIIPDDFPGRDILIRQLAEYPSSDFDDIPCAAALLSQHRERRGLLPDLPAPPDTEGDPERIWPSQLSRPPIRRGGWPG